MQRIILSHDTETIVSTSSKGDQSKWFVGDKWVKENTLGYESIAEYIAYLILECSILPKDSYVAYTPCIIEKPDGTVTEGCYSTDFRGTLQEVTLERLFEANFETTNDLLSSTRYSTEEKYQFMMDKIFQFTGLDVSEAIAQMLAFDALILNEDRHTNNILFLFEPKEETWRLALIFDHGLSLLSDVRDYPLSVSIDVLKRKVKAKPFNSSFKKQLALYKGEPFIDRTALLEKLKEAPCDLGRAKEVILSQLAESQLQRIFMG